MKVAFRSPCIFNFASSNFFQYVQLSYDNLPAILERKNQNSNTIFHRTMFPLKYRFQISAFAHLTTTTKIVYRSRVVPMIVPKHWTVEPENGIVEGKRHCSPPGRWRKYAFINLIIRAIVRTTTGKIKRLSKIVLPQKSHYCPVLSLSSYFTSKVETTNSKSLTN